jgi:hypothetical protein
MKETTNPGGSFTLAGTSLTVNRTGYGAMQLAGQDGDWRVWAAARYSRRRRRSGGAVAFRSRRSQQRRTPNRTELTEH